MNEDTRASAVRAPLIIGFLLAGGALLALGLFADRLRRAPDDAGLPALTLITPAAEDTVAGGPVRVLFQSGEPLRLGSMGWVADDLHPHILLDGRELMAGASDIRETPDGYEWLLPAVAPGAHTLLLAWAASHHGTVGDTAGRSIRFHSR
jgi:hypothetical protein